MNKKVKTGIIAAVWILIWQLAAWVMDQPIVLVGPADVCRRWRNRSGSRNSG